MTSDSPRVRTFFAVEIAPEICARLVVLKTELAGCNAAVRWVRDENLHVTLKFLGGVAEGTLPILREALSAALTRRAALPAAVRGLGVFPNLARARVIWVGLDCPGLADVATTVDAALAPHGIAAETRPFAAHLTLGRVKERTGWAALERALRAHQDDDFGVCRLTELVAFRSDLRRDGALYTKLWTIPFGG